MIAFYVDNLKAVSQAGKEKNYIAEEIIFLDTRESLGLE